VYFVCSVGAIPMTPEIQTFLALLVVAIAVAWLVRRTLAKRKNPGCGGDCGCPTDELKAKLKR
jgi:FeoB-associated Cys-rich membrane protein